MSDTEVLLGLHVLGFAALWIASLVENRSAWRLIKSLYRLIEAQNRRNDAQHKLIAAQQKLIATLRRTNDMERNRSLRFEAIARRN